LVFGAGLCALHGCVVGASQPQSQAELAKGPPAPLAGEPAGTRAGEEWVDGYWHYNGARYVWVPGRWQKRDPAYTWVPR
jgi:hypothetical protein